MARKFMFDGKELPDPDPGLKIDEVRDMHAEFLPELFNASHTEKKDGENTVITFKKNVGTKGAGREPTKEGYYWAQKADIYEFEVVQVKGGPESFFTVFRCGFLTYYTVDDFVNWGKKVNLK
jgi:PRTRC genetic system protein C